MKNQGFFAITVFITFSLVAMHVQAASFDCAKANTKIEKMICGNAELSKLDEEMTRAYHLKEPQTASKQILLQEQRHWLNQVRNTCNDVDCLLSSYKSRINELTLPAASQIHISEEDEINAKKIILGSWEPGSRAYYLLNIEISDKTITLANAPPVPYSILKFENGDSQTRISWIKGKWHRVVVQLNSKYYQILEFTIQHDSDCSAGITLYQTIKQYTENPDAGYEGFGSWENTDC